MTAPTSDLALQWARIALAQYALRAPTVHFLGHSDNLTFRVEAQGGAVYLLRLHQPVLHYWRGDRQKPAVIASELAWLESLAWEGQFTVQQPLRTQDGNLVALVNHADGETEPLPATLLTWLEGEHFSPAVSDAPSIAAQYGALTARLHAFSSAWQPPVGLARPVYDANHFKRMLSRLVRGVDKDIFPDEVYRILRATNRKILEKIARMPDDPQFWGLIHADLHMGNILINTGQVIPIDFSFCGFGHYAYDLSVCLAGGLRADLRDHFLEGYRSVRPLPESDFGVVDAYALAGRLSYYAYQIDNPAERDWLRRRLPEVARGECRRFLEGETILCTL